MQALGGHLRALLRDVICGHLDRDLVSLADELLDPPTSEHGSLASERASDRDDEDDTDDWWDDPPVEPAQQPFAGPARWPRDVKATPVAADAPVSRRPARDPDVQQHTLPF